MNKPVKIILGVVVLGSLIALFLYFRPGHPASPSSTISPTPTPVPGGFKTATPPPVAHVEPPALPPTPAGAADPTGTAAEVATLHNATADIASLLQKGDFAAIANKYGQPGGEKDILDTLQRMAAEGESGQIRLRQLTRVFAALASQTPQFGSDNTQAKFYDRTIYGLTPPVPLEKLSPGTDPDTIIRVPVSFIKQDGHWYLLGLGSLYGPLHNVSIAKMAAQDSTSS